jgi:type I restriction enzyme R subunit
VGEGEFWDINMSLSEADTKAKLIDPALHQRGWPDETREHYEAPTFEDLIQLPDRVKTMSGDLFKMFLQTGGPHQKTVIFCTRDTHADAVASEMNNLYAQWCTQNGESRLDPYAFKCTAAVGGSQFISDLRGSERSHFIATTVDLITTGVDVPILRNVVFFKYVRSPISFQQMMGRGSRIHLPTNKLMFRVYDYTNATRLLGKDFKSRPSPSRESVGAIHESPKEKIIRVEGFDVHINPAGTYIVTKVGDRLGMVTIEEYKQKLAQHLIEEAKTLDDFRSLWIDPQKRKTLIGLLPDDGQGLRLIRELLKETEPSSEDINITNRIIQACDFVGIKVLDHIIIGKNKEDYFSFANARLIK